MVAQKILKNVVSQNQNLVKECKYNTTNQKDSNIQQQSKNK